MHVVSNQHQISSPPECRGPDRRTSVGRWLSTDVQAAEKPTAGTSSCACQGGRPDGLTARGYATAHRQLVAALAKLQPPQTAHLPAGMSVYSHKLLSNVRLATLVTNDASSHRHHALTGSYAKPCLMALCN